MTPKSARSWAAVACCSCWVTSGCSFDGINSLPLAREPSAPAKDATTYRVQLVNVGTLGIRIHP